MELCLLQSYHLTLLRVVMGMTSHYNSEYDIIIQDGGTYTNNYLLMNWGWNGLDNNGYFASHPSAGWIGDNNNYKYNKEINYDFR